MTDENSNGDDLLVRQLFQQRMVMQPCNNTNSDEFVNKVMRRVRYQLWLRSAVLTLMAVICSLILVFQLVSLVEIAADSYDLLLFMTLSNNWKLAIIPGSILILCTAFLLMLDFATDQ